jgi:dipeptidyl aminopeptidase/acylaminoacyl peptidase
LVLLSLAAIAVALSFALGDDESLHSMIFGGRLVSGGWGYRTSSPSVMLAEQSPVTGFAFGPGRNEVAFCAPARKDGDSRLWLVQAPVPVTFNLSKPPWPIAPSRLLWTAPTGVTLRGPLVWSPNGARIAVLACRDKASDLVVVDYATKEAAWITHDGRVTGAAWNPGGDRIAYVNEESGKAAVLLQTFPPGEPKRIGSGGISLRWSADGKALRWMEATSETSWTEMIYAPAIGETKPGNVLPPRPVGAMWSPDGRLSAYIAEPPEGKDRQLIICQAEATSAAPVPLPGLKMRQLLGWSPDGNLLLVLDDKGWLYAVSVHAADPALVAIFPRGYSKARASAVAAGVTPTGPPSWSSSGELLVYVMTDENDPEFAWVRKARFPAHVPFDKLVVSEFAREYFGPGPQAERQQIVLNMKKIALALQMYVTDYDRYLPTDDPSSIRRILDEYLSDPKVFFRPGTEDDVIVKYLLPPGVASRDALQGREASEVQVAIVEYPTYTVIAYADGQDRKSVV